jgi:MFS family permease
MDSPSQSPPRLLLTPSAARAACPPAAKILAVAATETALFTSQFVRLLVVQHVFGLSFSVYFLMPKYLATELGANASTIGATAAVPLVTGVLLSPLIGRALDRYGRRALLLLGASIGAVTSLGMAAVHGVGLALYAVRALQGVGFALVTNSTAALVADHAPPSRLGHAMGLLGAASLAANAIAPAVSEHAAELWGWPAVFVATASMSLLTGALAWRAVETQRLAGPESRSAEGTGILRLNYAGAVVGAAFGTLTTFTQPLALERGAERIAGFFFGYAASALFVRVAFGSAVDRVGRLRVSRVALVLYGCVTLGTAWIQPELLVLFGSAFGLAHGLIFPALAALVVSKSDPARRGSALTTFHAAFNGGCGLSLFGCGLLARTIGYPLVFAGVGALTLISVLSLRARAA